MAKKKNSKKTTKKVVQKTSNKSAKKSTAKKASKKAVSKKSPKKSAVKKLTKKVVKKTVKKNTAKKATKTSAKQKTQQSTTKFTPHTTSLKPGMRAPYWESIDQNGNIVNSNSLLGRKVVLYFYPKDDTPGCTKEACNIRDNYQKYLDAGYTVYGVSADDTVSHKKFIEKYQLPFPLISDTEKNIIRAFDVWGKKQFMGKVSEGIIRTTFVIDENGIITDVITKVDVDNHTNQILK